MIAGFRDLVVHLLMLSSITGQQDGQEWACYISMNCHVKSRLQMTCRHRWPWK